jgi:hypothetical protein
MHGNRIKISFSCYKRDCRFEKLKILKLNWTLEDEGFESVTTEGDS